MLLAEWLPSQVWYAGPPDPDLDRPVFFRFDDPAGEVGIETLFVRAENGPLLQVPLTYRAAPLEGYDRWLVGTTEHSVLGRRWVYDGCGDPVYADALANAIHTGGAQAEEMVDTDGVPIRRDPTMTVRGSGLSTTPWSVGSIVRVSDSDPTIIVTASVELTVIRNIDAAPGGGGEHLTGAWVGHAPVIVAYARPIG